MTLKTARPTKVQRGISLKRDLYERIVAEADKYGRTFNETVELVLTRAFGASRNSHNPAVNASIAEPSDDLVVFPEGDDDR